MGHAFDHGAELVAGGLEGLAVQHAVDDLAVEPVHVDTMDREALDLVHVHALVDPGDEQILDRGGLGADVAGLVLLDVVWGYGHDGYEHTVNSHINRLRSKIEGDHANPEWILTVWGVGYKFREG